MKRKGLFIFLVLVLIGAAGLFYAYQNLGSIVQTILKDELPGLSFQDLDVGLTQVTASNIEYAPPGKKARLQTKNLSIQPSLFSLLSDTFEVNDITITEPVLDVRKPAKQGGLELPVPAPATSTPAKTGTKQNDNKSVKKAEQSSRNIHIGSARMINGRVNFIDESVAGKPAIIMLNQVNFAAKDVFIPSRAGSMPLELTFMVPAKRTGSVSLKGFADRVARSGEMGLKASNIFVPLLAPYYQGPEISLELSDGRFSADVQVKMTGGKYKITGFAELADLKIERGQFHGFSAKHLKEYFEQHPEPIKVDLALEGDLDEPGSMRRSVLRTIVQALVKYLGEGRLEGAKQKLKQGDVEGAKQELKDLKRELKNLFKR